MYHSLEGSPGLFTQNPWNDRDVSDKIATVSVNEKYDFFLEERRAAREQRKADRKQKREERKGSPINVTWDKPSPPSSSESDSSDSDDNSSGGANEEPPDGINTARNNGKFTLPNHGSEDSEKAFDASAVGDVKDDSKFLNPLIDSPDPAADNPSQVGKRGRASYPIAGLPDIGPCTYRACLAIAETRTGHNLSPDQIAQGVKDLREAGTLSGWYVNSPVDVIDYGLSTLGSKEKSEWISRSTDFDQNPIVPEGSQASLVKTRENIYGYQHFGEGDSQGNVIWDGYGSDTIETVHRVDFFKFIQKE